MPSRIDMQRLAVPLAPVRKPAHHSSSKNLRLWAKGVNDREKTNFCLQLAVMLQAKVPLLHALEAIEQQSGKNQMASAIKSLRGEIQKGNSFSKSLAAIPGIFDNLFVVSVEIGQESGRLAEVLVNLAAYLEKIGMLRRKFVHALAYPMLVLCVALFAVWFMMDYIVPNFAEMFRSFRVELPFATRVVFALSAWVSTYGWVGFAGVLVAVIITFFSFQNESVRRQMESLILRLPVVGEIVLMNHVSRFCRSLATMLQAQVPLLDALYIMKRIVTIPELLEELEAMARHVKRGATLASPVSNSKFFPPMVSQMISVGEETSELDTMLAKVSEYYENEMDSKIETLSTLLEPLLIIILGVVVAVVVISMYMPMFDLVNAIGVGT